MNKDKALQLANEMAVFASIWVDDGSNEVSDLVKFANFVAKTERNRLADELQKMPLNDTANSIAIWIRGQE